MNARPTCDRSDPGFECDTVGSSRPGQLVVRVEKVSRDDARTIEHGDRAQLKTGYRLEVEVRTLEGLLPMVASGRPFEGQIIIQPKEQHLPRISVPVFVRTREANASLVPSRLTVVGPPDQMLRRRILCRVRDAELLTQLRVASAPPFVEVEIETLDETTAAVDVTLKLPPAAANAETEGAVVLVAGTDGQPVATLPISLVSETLR